MPRFKDQAICIRHFDWSETSQIVALLTEHHGKIRAVAKGAKRTSPSSVQRYSGGIELLTLGQAVGIIKPTTELATLTEWDLQQPYWHLRQDLEAQQLSLYAADLVNALLADRDDHPASFHALREFLEALRDPTGRQAALLRFQWRILTDSGYRPELNRDVERDEPLTPAASYIFDAQAGGLTTQLGSQRTSWKVRRETVELLRRVAQNDVDDLRDADPQAIGRANRLLCVYARSILDRELPTMAFVL